MWRLEVKFRVNCSKNHSSNLTEAEYISKQLRIYNVHLRGINAALNHCNGLGERQLGNQEKSKFESSITCLHSRVRSWVTIWWIHSSTSWNSLAVFRNWCHTNTDMPSQGHFNCDIPQTYSVTVFARDSVAFLWNEMIYTRSQSDETNLIHYMRIHRSVIGWTWGPSRSLSQTLLHYDRSAAAPPCNI